MRFDGGEVERVKNRGLFIQIALLQGLQRGNRMIISRYGVQIVTFLGVEH